MVILQEVEVWKLIDRIIISHVLLKSYLYGEVTSRKLLVKEILLADCPYSCRRQSKQGNSSSYQVRQKLFVFLAKHNFYDTTVNVKTLPWRMVVTASCCGNAFFSMERETGHSWFGWWREAKYRANWKQIFYWLQKTLNNTVKATTEGFSLQLCDVLQRFKVLTQRLWIQIHTTPFQIFICWNFFKKHKPFSIHCTFLRHSKLVFHKNPLKYSNWPSPFFFCPTEKYFDMKKNQCKEALEIYKNFLNRMTKLSEFLKVAEVLFVCPALC